MRHIFLILIFVSGVFASVIKSPITSIDASNNTATIKIEKIDVGMSGFIVHKLGDTHSTVLKNIVVSDYDSETQIATLKISEFNELDNSALPTGRWSVEVGDTAVLAFGYTRGLLIAPNEDIYHKIVKSTDTMQWVHPDIFATILSVNGHPTPLKEDFDVMSSTTSLGLVFFYIDKRLFTLDSKSFKILNISDADLEQKKEKLPFYTRVEEIDASWWGEGSDELKEYGPHYYKLMIEFNKENKKLYEIIKADEKLKELLKDFKIEGK